MAATKDLVSIVNASIAVSGSPTQPVYDVDLTDSYGFSLDLKATNGATGPTVALSVQLQVSSDTGTPANWFDFGGLLTAKTGNNVVTSWGGIEIPEACDTCGCS